MTTYRILSLDGGGIKGMFPASFLATIEEDLSYPIGSYFDLIVGTSTGGILALGFGLGFKAADLLGFYEKLGRDVFRGHRIMRFFKRLGISKYSPEQLREALEGVFGDRKLGHSQTRLVIPSMNIETGEVHIYKTSHHPHLQIDYKVPVVEVAMATAAAPTYFPTYRSASGIPLVDGGMWANNPVGVAVVEAIGMLGWNKNQIRVLSIGCTCSPLNVGLARRLSLGMLYWAFKAADVFMSGQSSGSLGTAQLLAGHENIFRINPTVPRGRFELDVIREMDSLRGLGESEARKAISKLKPVFFQEPVDPFIPCHSLPSLETTGGV